MRPGRGRCRARGRVPALSSGPGATATREVLSAREPDSITLEDVKEARKRLDGIWPRTTLIKLDDGGTGELYLKLENLPPIRSFKVRGSGNAITKLDPGLMQAGVHTARAGDMAQGVAWKARRPVLPCTALLPHGRPPPQPQAVHPPGARTNS